MSASAPLDSRVPIRRGARLVAAIGASAWALGLAAACAVKYRFFLYRDFDLAIFSQALFGALRGRWFSSIRGMHWLGDHSSIALLLLAPLAALVRHPLLLPVAQSAALALGAWPAFVYARRRLGHEGLAAGFAILWLLQPALLYTGLFEFHPETLATPALLGLACLLELERVLPALLCAGVAALAKEDAALPIAVLGLVELARRRPRGAAAGWGLLAIAAGSLALSFAVLKPLLAHGEAQYGDMYARWGRSPGAVAIHVITHPLPALAAFVTTRGDAADTLAKHQYWLHVLLPLLGLPLVAPLGLLPALPVLAEHFLSSRIEQHSIVYQYTALTSPFLLVAAVDGFRRVALRDAGPPDRLPRRAIVVMAAAVAAALVAQGLYGPFAPAPRWLSHRPTEHVRPTERDATLARWRRAFMARCPRRGALVADFSSLAPLSLRDSVHALHHVSEGTYTYSSRPYPEPAGVTGLIADTGEEFTLSLLTGDGGERVAALARHDRLHLADEAGDLVLLRSAPAETLAWLAPAADSIAPTVRFDDALDFLGAAIPDGAPAEPGGRVAIRTVWRRADELPDDPLVEWILTDARGHVRDDDLHLLGFGISPPADWPVGRALAERYAYTVPASLAPGAYTLSLSARWWGDDTTRAAVTADPAVVARHGVIEVGRITVRARS